jgi:hypothetical protein
MHDRKRLAPIVFWFAVGVLLLVVLELAVDPFLWLILLPLVLLFYGGYAVLLFASYFRNAIKVRDKRSWVAAASIPALLALLVVMDPLIGIAVQYAEFAVMLPTYSRIVEVVEKGSKLTDEIEYSVDRGPPVRVAFAKGGIIDNWMGVVYDPSDAVAQAKGWDFSTGKQTFTAPPGVKELFGGDMVACSHLYGHYYLCGFT